MLLSCLNSTCLRSLPDIGFYNIIEYFVFLYVFILLALIFYWLFAWNNPDSFSQGNGLLPWKGLFLKLILFEVYFWRNEFDSTPQKMISKYTLELRKKYWLSSSLAKLNFVSFHNLLSFQKIKFSIKLSRVSEGICLIIFSSLIPFRKFQIWLLLVPDSDDIWKGRVQGRQFFLVQL